MPMVKFTLLQWPYGFRRHVNVITITETDQHGLENVTTGGSIIGCITITLKSGEIYYLSISFQSRGTSTCMNVIIT